MCTCTKVHNLPQNLRTMSPAETYYHQIAAELEGAVESKMFGAKCLKAANGKALALYYQECMVFKLTAEPASAALSLDGAQMFTPAAERPPMNGWIQVPFVYADQWKAFAEAAFAYVSALQK